MVFFTIIIRQNGICNCVTNLCGITHNLFYKTCISVVALNFCLYNPPCLSKPIYCFRKAAAYMNRLRLERLVHSSPEPFLPESLKVLWDTVQPPGLQIEHVVLKFQVFMLCTTPIV